MIRHRILEGDTAAFFRDAEHVVGQPRQAVDVREGHSRARVVRWQMSASRLEAGRRRKLLVGLVDRGGIEPPTS